MRVSPDGDTLVFDKTVLHSSVRIFVDDAVRRIVVYDARRFGGRRLIAGVFLYFVLFCSLFPRIDRSEYAFRVADTYIRHTGGVFDHFAEIPRVVFSASDRRDRFAFAESVQNVERVEGIVHGRLAAVLIRDIQARLVRLAGQRQSFAVCDQIRTTVLLTERVAPVPVNDDGFMDVPRRDKGRFHSFDQVFPIIRR